MQTDADFLKYVTSFSNPKKSTRPEALLFIVLYILYCIGMGFNSHFEKWANERLPVPSSWKAAVQQQQGGVGLDAEGNTNYTTMQGNSEKLNGEHAYSNPTAG